MSSLKQTSTKYTARPSPAYSASDFEAGTRKWGNDRRMYVNVADKNGTMRWVWVGSGGGAKSPRMSSPRAAAAGTKSPRMSSPRAPKRVAKPDVGAYYMLRCTEFETGKHVTFRARCAASAVDEDGSGYEHTFDLFKKTLPEWLTQVAQVEGVLVFSQSATSVYTGLYAGDRDVSADLSSM